MIRQWNLLLQDTLSKWLLNQECSTLSPLARSTSQCLIILPTGLPMGPQGAPQAMALRSRSGAQGSAQPDPGMQGPRTQSHTQRARQRWCRALDPDPHLQGQEEAAWALGPQFWCMEPGRDGTRSGAPIPVHGTGQRQYSVPGRQSQQAGLGRSGMGSQGPNPSSQG